MKSLTSITLITLTCVLSSRSFAAENDLRSQIPLYLPIVSGVYPTLTQKLDAALKAESVQGVKVHNADFWHPYQQGLRKGRKGIYFAQPHFAAWAATQHGFDSIYKLHGRLKYVLATRRSNGNIFELSDLGGSVICREAGLNLGTVWLNSVLSEHQITARSKELPSVEHAMQKDNHKCDAFVIDDYGYARSNQQELGKYIRLAQSPVYKHNAFIAHPDVSPELITALEKALKSKRIKRLLQPYFENLSQWQNLLPVREEDYRENDAELLKTYWGH